MKKKLFLVCAFGICIPSIAQAKQNVCVFDLLGKAGESYKVMEEWALAAKNWGADINLVAYKSEEQADKDFKTNKCDAVAMTTMRSREYNKFGGSIDALGSVPSYAIAQKAIAYALDKRNDKRLISVKNGIKYELAGISPLGMAYIFVRDRKIDSFEKAKGVKFAYLHYDIAQKAAVDRVGAIGVPSDLSNFVKRFNSGEVDSVPAPAYAFKPLEVYKGLGTKGAMFTYPVMHVTADIIIKADQFPNSFGSQSRAWSLKRLPKTFKLIERLEAEIPTKYKLNISKEDEIKYQKLLREVRIELTKQGVYDATMMSVLKRARCTVERTNFECSLTDE
ncbi:MULTISPECIES: putative solute-binding protein [Acinetobacter]|uniref:RND transporter n=1 Tax=Acinetobacter piscicola TaxID=2006115 RepID=A0A4Q4GUK5_9GAMM|nr:MULTISPECIES: putative solute-binding protein [Acinetobacter]MDM1758796.1 RND transporter [Acinetobacter sp. 256-1]MDM1762199.1 RND transporter [Acinetobacter sp. 251-1]QOW44438.1 RND transporter [Acinetobacter piscicola]RYL22855.1 RND transporter [Acinetobacter piscicola]